LLLVQRLPLLAELLADLAWGGIRSSYIGMVSEAKLTELDTRVVLTDLVTLLVGEEHVGGQTTLGRVRVYYQSERNLRLAACERLTLLLLAALSLGGLALTAGYLLLRHDVVELHVSC
jgi:hypothetical protein